MRGFRGPLRDPLRGRFPSQRLSVLLPLFVLPLELSPIPFFVLFCPFSDFPDFSGIFPICAGMVRGFSRFVLFLFLSLLIEHLRGTVPKGSATQSEPFPEKSGKHPGLETPRFSFSQDRLITSFLLRGAGEYSLLGSAQASCHIGLGDQCLCCM